MSRIQDKSNYDSNANFKRISNGSSKSFNGIFSQHINTPVNKDSSISSEENNNEVIFNSSQPTLVETSGIDDEDKRFGSPFNETTSIPIVNQSKLSPISNTMSDSDSAETPVYSEPVSRDAREDLILKLLPEKATTLLENLTSLKTSEHSIDSNQQSQVNLRCFVNSSKKRRREISQISESRDDSPKLKNRKLRRSSSSSFSDSSTPSSPSPSTSNTVHVSIPSIISSKFTIPFLMTPIEAFLYMKVKSAIQGPITNPKVIYKLDELFHQLFEGNISIKFIFTASQFVQLLCVYGSSISVENDNEPLILRVNFQRKDRIRLFLVNQKQTIGMNLSNRTNDQSFKEKLNNIKNSEEYIKFTLIEDKTFIQLERLIPLKD